MKFKTVERKKSLRVNILGETIEEQKTYHVYIWSFWDWVRGRKKYVKFHGVNNVLSWYNITRTATRLWTSFTYDILEAHPFKSPEEISDFIVEVHINPDKFEMIN